MRENISNDRLVERIVSKVKRMNDGDDMNVENELYYALDRIESASSTGDDYDLGSNLYWLLLNTYTESRLKSYADIRIGRKRYNLNDCDYFPDGFLCATVGMKVYDEEVYPALISNVNSDFSVEINDPHSLQSIKIAYEALMNDLMNYYEGLKTMYRNNEYMNELVWILNWDYPNVDWKDLTPKEMIDELMRMGKEDDSDSPSISELIMTETERIRSVSMGR